MLQWAKIHTFQWWLRGKITDILYFNFQLTFYFSINPFCFDFGQTSHWRVNDRYENRALNPCIISQIRRSWLLTNVYQFERIIVNFSICGRQKNRNFLINIFFCVSFHPSTHAVYAFPERLQRLQYCVRYTLTFSK